MTKQTLLDAAPKLSDNTLVCSYVNLWSKPVSVIVDRSTKMIHFQNCHVPSQFLAVYAQPWFSCPLNGLMAAHELHDKHRQSSLIIVTHAGKATVPSSAINYKQLRESMAPYTGNFSENDPQLQYFVVLCGTAGIFFAWLLLASSTSDTMFILGILGGAIVGVAIPLAIGVLIHRDREQSISQDMQKPDNQQRIAAINDREQSISQDMQKGVVASATASETFMESTHTAVFDLLCCVMVADGSSSTREHETIRELLSKVDIHWTYDEFDDRFAAFNEDIREQGYFNVVQRSMKRLPLLKQIGREEVLIKCLDLVAIADGELDSREKDLCDRIREVIGPIASDQK